MLYVSRFSNPTLKTDDYVAVRISLGTPKWPLGYVIQGAIGDLMPVGLLGIEDRDEFEQKYRARLDRIGALKIMKQIKAMQGERDKDVVLLCYEDVRDPSQWCHRTIFAEWWYEQTGQRVDELHDPSVPRMKTTPSVVKKDAAPSKASTPTKAELRTKSMREDGGQLSMFD